MSKVQQVATAEGCRKRVSDLKSDNAATHLIDVEILYLLRKGSQTLYSIRRDLSNVFAEDRSFGTIHPHLVKLEEKGLIKGHETHPSENGPYKRPYVITRKGRHAQERQLNSLAKVILKMTA